MVEKCKRCKEIVENEEMREIDIGKTIFRMCDICAKKRIRELNNAKKALWNSQHL